MIDSKCRSKYQSFLIDPLLKQNWILNLDPKLLTFFGLIFGLFTALLTGFHYPIAAVICLVLSGFFDTLDGSLARILDKVSDQGAVLDITSDRIVELGIVFGLYFISPHERGFLCLLMLSSILICITSFLVVGIFTQNASKKSFFYSPGIMERTEAFAFFALMIALPSLFFFLAITFSLLVALTGLIRVYEFISRPS